MDLKYASDPSQSTWEAPPMPELDELRAFTAQKSPVAVTPRAENLARAQRQLNELCSSTAPRAGLEEFLAAWQDPLQPDHIQPNALAWFQAAEPLARAIENGREDVARILLAYGVKPKRPDVWAALDILKATGSRTALEMLLDGGWGINEPLNEDSSSILGYFVDSNLDLVQWCLTLGASPNASSPMGKTAMHRAAAFGSLDTLKLFVNHGGLVADTDLVAHAALSYCNGDESRLEVIKYLLDHGALIDAYFMGHSERWNCATNSLFLTYGRQNALHFAITYGRKELIEMLLARGADRTLKMFSLRTKLQQKEPWELASLLGHEDIAMLLSGIVRAADHGF